MTKVWEYQFGVFVAADTEADAWEKVRVISEALDFVDTENQSSCEGPFPSDLVADRPSPRAPLSRLPDRDTLAAKMVELGADPRQTPNVGYIRAIKGWAKLALRAIRALND